MPHVSELATRHRRALLAAVIQPAWHMGHCGETREMHDARDQCMLDSSGAIKLPWFMARSEVPEHALNVSRDRRWLRAAKWCSARCASCHRCHYVSVSLHYDVPSHGLEP